MKPGLRALQSLAPLGRRFGDFHQQAAEEQTPHALKAKGKIAAIMRQAEPYQRRGPSEAASIDIRHLFAYTARHG